MRHKCTVSIIAILVCLGSIALGGHPRVNDAENKLRAALQELEKSRGGDASKHIGEAVLDLNAAKTLLAETQNNKGSYLPTAKKLIDQATEELTATPLDTAHIDKGTELIRQALQQTSRALATANHNQLPPK